MITAKQREMRKKYLGSSDAPKVCGVSPWGGQIDVYFEKKADAEKEVNEAMSLGNYLENPIAQWFSDTYKKKVTSANLFRVSENGIMSTNFDRFVVGADEAVEIKSAGIVSPLPDRWREAVEKGVTPEDVTIQCVHQLAVLPQLQRIWVPCLLGFYGFRLFVIERDSELIDMVTKIECDFWNRYIVPGVQPEGIPDLSLVKSLKRLEGKSVPVDRALIDVWLDAKAKLKDATEFKEMSEAKMLAALGDAEIGESAGGILKYIKEGAGVRVDSDLLEERYPEIKKEVSYPATRRVLRWKADKPPKVKTAKKGKTETAETTEDNNGGLLTNG